MIGQAGGKISMGSRLRSTGAIRVARCGALAGIFALMLLPDGGSLARAESFCPEANVKIVAPFPPGGPTDVTARLLAEKLRVQFGQTVITESRPGASGSIGTGFVAQQPGN